jgi:hypothetical protein
MDKTIETVVRTCDACQKDGKEPLKEPLKPYLGSTLFRRIGLDLVEMPRAEGGENYIVIARDDFSGWVEAAAIKNKESATVYEFLYDQVIARFGIPQEVLADRGELYALTVQEAAQRDGITLRFTTAFHPQTNGMVERGHKSLVSALRKLTAHEPNQWPKYLSAVLWADRISWKRTTGEAPYKVVYGQDCVLPMDLDHESWIGLDWAAATTEEDLLELRAQQLMRVSWIREKSGLKVDKSRRYNKAYYDRQSHIRTDPLQAGELVLLRDMMMGKKDSKVTPRWKGPYRVRKEVFEGVYQLEDLNGIAYQRTISGHRIIRYFEPVV